MKASEINSRQNPIEDPVFLYRQVVFVDEHIKLYDRDVALGCYFYGPAMDPKGGFIEPCTQIENSRGGWITRCLFDYGKDVDADSIYARIRQDERDWPHEIVVLKDRLRHWLPLKDSDDIRCLSEELTTELSGLHVGHEPT